MVIAQKMLSKTKRFSFGEEVSKIRRFENRVIACFNVHKFRMSGCRVCLGSPYAPFI